MFCLKQFKVKNIVMGLLLLNTLNAVSANEQLRDNNKSDDLFLQNQFTTHNDLLPQDSKQPESSALSNEEIKNKNTLTDSTILRLRENCVENFSIINQLPTARNIKPVESIKEESNSDNIDDNLFDNWTYNGDDCKQSVIKKKYQKLSSNLQKSTINFDIAPTLTLNNPNNARKLSDASRSSVKSHKSHFSNPLIISNTNKFKKLDKYLDGHKEIIPIITLQSDGLQVLDTIAHLSVFNSFYDLNNFGTSPYIYCASSAAIPGVSLALDLQKQNDPIANLELIGNKLYQEAQVKEDTESNTSKKSSCCCSWNAFKLFWLKIFGCCIDYENEDIVDSLYTRVSNNTVKNTMKDVLDLTNKSNVNIPNLIIKDVNSDANIIDQILQANKNQDKKSTKNQVTLFSKPFISVIKNFIKSDKKIVEKGINFAENNIKNDALIKINSNDEIKFMEQKNLNDSTTDRLAIIISSNVDTNDQIQNDINSVKIEQKEVEYEGSKDKLHVLKIILYTNNSITNPNYSLRKKYDNMRAALSNSKEFLHIIEKLPQMSSMTDSSVIHDDNLSDNNTPIQEEIIIDNKD